MICVYFYVRKRRGQDKLPSLTTRQSGMYGSLVARERHFKSSHLVCIALFSACEKGLVPHKALEIFDQMKREGVKPTVVTYSALISAAEKGQQWKLALEVLEEMKAAGHGANVIAYSAAISALSKGQMWHKALELFREIEASGGKPSIVTYNVSSTHHLFCGFRDSFFFFSLTRFDFIDNSYNLLPKNNQATITALESKSSVDEVRGRGHFITNNFLEGLQWERALDLFDEMKLKNMPITVVSYGSAISACEKGRFVVSDSNSCT